MGARGQMSPRSAPSRVLRSFCSGQPRHSVAPAVAPKPPISRALPFEAIPRSSPNAWVNLYQFWRTNSFPNFHHIMQKNFQNLGPIYRETLGTYDSVHLLLPRDAAVLFQSEGIFPRRMGINSWIAHRTLRNHKCGVFLLNGEDWRSDRLILNKEVISPVGTRKFLPFLNTVAEDFAESIHRLIRKNARRSLTVDLHRDLFRFTLEADKCIQNIYQEFCLGQPRKYSGIMAELLLQEEMPLDSIKANMTELTAGSVDTTAMPLLFTLFELARNPQVQTALREEVKAAAVSSRELSKVMNDMPLLKGAIKETLRLYPVGITVQRYPMRDVVLQNYCVPAGTLCQVGLYAMGRSPEVFRDPERYDPSRWTGKEDSSFKALAFGFGSRQCIGRRLAEAEMTLFLMHILRNFKIDTVSKADLKTVYGFILMPEKPPLLTFRPID
ncbi:cytochrome P450 11B, mitochondrial-like [Podarcis lilfordi]|uniref:steroid 11beta-monooxygenase n=1 Tax=Podarcis lilfordi TaxID=74358 RepID=A0AA35PB47_9SAUR|nr:cytochrome P450 11B, mitochondrial-like [Podarcis lilfordi]